MTIIPHVYSEFRAELILSFHSNIPIGYLFNVDLIGLPCSNAYDEQPLLLVGIG